MSKKPLCLFSSARLRAIAAISLLLVTMACGGNPGAPSAVSSAGTGSISFAVEWETTASATASAIGEVPSLPPMAPAIDVCTDYGIATVTMQVLSGQTVKAEVSVPCENHGTTLNGVSAENNLVLHLMGSITGVGNVWNGYSVAFNLAPGEAKDIGKVIMSYTGTDKTPPTVLSFSPSDNAVHVLDNSTIRVVFSEKMAVNTVQDNGSIVVADNVSGPVPGGITYDPSSNSATFTPASPLRPGAVVSVSVTDVATDMAGNKLASTRAWSFFVHVPGQFLNPFLLELDDYPKFTVSSEVAMSGNGNAVVVWEQYDGAKYNINSNRYTSSTGSWSGTEILEYTDGDANYPRVAMDSAGNAIAVWHQYAGPTRNIMYNKFEASTGIWSEMGAGALSSGTDNTSYPQVAMNGNGNAIAVWEQFAGAGKNIVARRYQASTGVWSDYNGVILSNGAGDAEFPEVAMSGKGDAIAVWGQSDGIQNNIWANRYSAADNVWSGAFPLENNTGFASSPKISMDGNGNAIAVWYQEDGATTHIWANRYSASGNAWSGAFLLESQAAGSAYDPQVAMDGNGNALAVWSQQLGGESHIWANRYSASGNAWSGAFLLEDKGGNMDLPHVSMGGNGDATVTWRAVGGPTWYNRYRASADTWSGPIILSGEGGSHLRVAMDGNGNAIAVWDDAFAGRLTSHVWASQTK